MERKALGSPLSLKLDGQAGEFIATFSTLNVIDLDRDVTLPGAFKDGQAVRIAQWSHNWGALPVGKGIIHADTDRAWVEGSFFTDTTHGMDTYRTVKQLEDLQEWSYGFEVLDSSPGEFEGQPVRFLRALDVIEVSPVMLGAGIGTHTDTIKAATSSIDLPYAEALAAALTAIKAGSFDLDTLDGIIERTESRSAYRTKAGRVLSEANRTMLRELHGYLSDHSSALGGHSERLAQLLSATDPSEPKGESPAAHSSLALLRQQFDFTRARIGAL
jgi:hypothetical protein